MNLNLPSVGLGRGRVWRSQAWVGGAQSTKPWLGTLNSETSEIVGAGRRSSGGSCVWAEGHDLPYIQQLMSDAYAFRDSLYDFRLPSPTTSSSPTSRDWSQHQQSRDDVTADVKPCNDSIEIIHNNEENEIERCIGILDEILDLYDADDDAELYPSTQPPGDVTSSHLLPLRSCAKTAVRNLEIRRSMAAVHTEITEVEEANDAVEILSLDHTSNEEPYARRKQVPQQSASTVSSSDSAVFLQCNEQSTEGDFDAFYPSPSMQDDHSNPDSGYHAVNTDADSVNSASAAGSKRSVGSDGSSRLTSLRSCRWLTGATADMDAVSTAAAPDDDETVAPSSGSTLTNASSSQPSSLVAYDADETASVINVAGQRAPADATANIAGEEPNDGTVGREDVALTTSGNYQPPLPPPPPPASLKPTSTRPSDNDDESLPEFPPPPPLTLPAASPSSAGPVVGTTKKLPPLPSPAAETCGLDVEEHSVFPPPPPMMPAAGGPADPSTGAAVGGTTKKLPPPPTPVKVTPTRTSGSRVEEFPAVFPPPPPMMLAAADSVSLSSDIAVASTRKKLPPPPPSLKLTSTRTSGSSVEEFPVFPPAPPMAQADEGSLSPSSDATVAAAPKKLPPPPTLPKASRSSSGSGSGSVRSLAAGAFAFHTSAAASPSSTLASRHSGTRNGLPPTPPAPPPPPLATASATNPPAPPPRPSATSEFPPPPTFPTLPGSSDTVSRASTGSVTSFTPPTPPAPPPPPDSVPLAQYECDADSEFPLPPTVEEESPYATIDDVLLGTNAQAGGLAAALRDAKLRPAADRVNPPDGAGQKDPISALVDQLHGGFQLRPTALGTAIRGRDSMSASSAEAIAEATQDDDDDDYANSSDIPLPKAPVKQLPPVPVKKTAPPKNTAVISSQAKLSQSADDLDVTQLPGYQVIPADCPPWKHALIEKKNASIISEATKQQEAKRQEEERWKDVPEWKRNLIAKKQERSAT